MAVRKTFAPQHDFRPGPSRHLLNPAIVILDALIIRLAFLVTAVGLALLAEARRWGVFNASSTRARVSSPLAVILLDLAVNLQWRSPDRLQPFLVSTENAI